MDDTQNVLHSPGLAEFAVCEGLWDPSQGELRPMLCLPCLLPRSSFAAVRLLRRMPPACGTRVWLPAACLAGPFNWLAAFMEDSAKDETYNYPRVSWLQSEHGVEGHLRELRSGAHVLQAGPQAGPSTTRRLGRLRHIPSHVQACTCGPPAPPRAPFSQPSSSPPAPWAWRT